MEDVACLTFEEKKIYKLLYFPLANMVKEGTVILLNPSNFCGSLFFCSLFFL
jgi:hypothetical protein